MMGHRDALRNGMEVDIVSRYGHRFWKAGVRVAAKRAINKRARKLARRELLQELAEV